MTYPIPTLSVAAIVQAVGGTLLSGKADTVCRGVSTDSRTLVPDQLFIALKGPSFDGHHYLEQAAQKGAAAVLVSQYGGALSSNIPVIRVADTLEALGALSRAWRRRFPVPVIAVTGSSGKTTTKEMMAAILGQSRRVLKTEGNYNNLIGLPLTLLRLQQQHDIIILEMGTNALGEIARLAEIAEPDIALITNIGPAHLEGFGSMKGVWEEKTDLFRRLKPSGTLILNLDDDYLMPYEENSPKERITFGLREDADISAAVIENRGAQGVRFILRIGAWTGEVSLAVAGRHNVSNALAAAAAASAAGASPQEIQAGLSEFRPVSGRMSLFVLKNGAHIMNDAYNANPASVREGLRTLQEWKGNGRGFAVLGDMLELGDKTAYWHAEIGHVLAETGVERVYIKGQQAQIVADAACGKGLSRDRVMIFADAAEAVAELRERLEAGDWVLVKGSRRMKMDEVVDGLVAAIGLREGVSPREGKDSL